MKKEKALHNMASYSESVSVTLYAVMIIMVLMLAAVSSAWLFINASVKTKTLGEEYDSMPNRYPTVSGYICDSSGVMLAYTQEMQTDEGTQRMRVYNEDYTRAMLPIVGYISSATGEGVDGIENAHRKWLKYGSSVASATGGSIRLTIDAQLQDELYRLMLSSSLYTNAAISCIDVNTGRVVAMCDIPSCSQNTLSNPANDPESYSGECSVPGAQLAQAFKSRSYHGSCFKVATAAVLANEEDILNNGNFIRDYSINTTSGVYYVLGIPIRTSAPADGQPMTLPRAIAYSNNYFFSSAAAIIGAGRIEQQYEMLFHLSKPIECDFGTIYSGAYDFSTQANFIRGVYGEGDMLISNLRMTMITAAVASDDGSFLRPYCIDTYIDNDGTTERRDIYCGRREALTQGAVTKPARDIISEGMALAAQRYSIGENENGMIGNVRVYAKTGTATSGENKNNIAMTCYFSAGGKTYALTLTAFGVEYSGENGPQGSQLVSDIEKAIEYIIAAEAA